MDDQAEAIGPCKSCGFEGELDRNSLCFNCQPPISEQVRSALVEALKPKPTAFVKRYATVGAYLTGREDYPDYWSETANYITSMFKAEVTNEKALKPCWWLAPRGAN